MKRTLLICLLLTAMLLPSPAPAEKDIIRQRVLEDLTTFEFPLEDDYLSEYAPSPEREAEAEAVFAGAKVRSGVLIVARHGVPLVECCYGVRNRAHDPVTLRTQFRIASVTKMVTAIGLMRLWEAGLFDLDAPLSSILPVKIANPAFPDQEITPRQVLSHTSTIRQGMRYFPNWESLPVKNDYFEHTAAPGSKYIYANLNGGLAGAMIEALSGQSVNTCMKAILFDPLKIDAAYNPGLLADISDMSDILYEDGTTLSTAKRELETLKDYDDTCDPMRHTDRTIGKLYINAEGLHRLASMMADGGTLGEYRLLYEDTVDMMQADQRTIPGSQVTAASDYGLFVSHVSPSGAYTWYGHQGRFNGITADVFWQPYTGMSFVMIVNGYNGALSTEGLAPIARRMMTLAEGWIN